ncbi:hypothetical protein CFP56_042416 [Quercus suber]|uniref:Uncharacterized protein n=1 Tax=Quercus suber TaxID=58331 RepID=A0AAW0IU47_QUESU
MDLIKNKFSSATLLLPSEKCFLEKFVIKFQANVPQLLDVYHDTSLISHRLTSSLPLPGTIFYLVLDQKSNTAATTAANTTTQINNLTNDRAKEII